MLFDHLALDLVIVSLFPFVLLGFLIATARLERVMLLPEEVVPRRIRRMRRASAERVEQMVLVETTDVVARYWSATGRPGRGRV